MIPTDAWLILSEVKPIECAWINFTPDLNGYEIIMTYSRNIYGFGRDRESYGLISGRTVLRYPHLKEVL
jgi:hypothetical protein